ncbi:uncharacterized protein [Nicotiana tomentosiformis]|uniref:uncharacterized protein n=1 Tax=Nicotiana tomentosiformis TaxID=4098 RepID=UPI00388CB50E
MTWFTQFHSVQAKVTSIKCGIVCMISSKRFTNVLRLNHLKGMLPITPKSSWCAKVVTIEDIHSKISTYFEGDDDASSSATSYHEKFFFLLNKFYKLQSWLTEQFSVKHFESLLSWEYLALLGEKYASA